MPTKILMPALSPTMNEGNLAKWFKKEGETITSGDIIAEIETDKATMEFEAVDEGTLAKIIIPEGTENVPVNAMIGVLLEEGEEDADVDAFIAANKDESKPQANDSAAPAPSAQTPAPAAPIATPTPVAPSDSHQDRVFISPLARRLAAQHGIQIVIPGSGPNGRIIKADIEAAIASGGNAQVVAAPQKKKGPSASEMADLLGIKYIKEKVSNVRKTIAERLTESKQEVPHFYLTVECNIDALLAARKELNTKADGKFKVSVNDYIIRACALALKKVPEANTSWNEDSILTYDHADISVAVATDNGLITPIVTRAEEKDLETISNEMKDLAGRAKEGKLKPTEFQGGSFSLSNLGMFGIKEFSAIINPPQACILAVGAGTPTPIVKDGKVVVGTMMHCTLSVDHRAVDGAVGAQFLAVFKELIENPEELK